MEIRVDFRSLDEWRGWRDQYSPQFEAWKSRLLDSIKTDGIIEPLTRKAVKPGELRIRPDNLRETLSYNGLNSRKRALLLELELLRRMSPRLAAMNARIFAAEALSRTALILRGEYPFFLGTEYIRDAHQRARYFPIAHADLMSLDFANEVFDVMMTGDVFEHIPDLERCIAELARTLKSEGWLLSTFPFAVDAKQTIVRAKLQGSDVVHLEKPEYHDDPLDKQGALVFQVPGWDVLDLCRSVGLHDARMVLHASTTYGIASNAPPGVFVLTARKAAENKRWVLRNWIWDSNIRRLVGVLGLPRSGTTMFTAVLDAHTRVGAIYEPWNANKKAVAAGLKGFTASTLSAELASTKPSARTLVVKETTSDQTFPNHLSSVLSEALPPLSQHLLVLLRNPLHCFLSEVEGRRKWWGEESLRISESVFTDWARKTLQSLEQILMLSERHPSSIVFYEACVARPRAVFALVMQEIDLEFEPEQINITKRSDLSKVRGDISLVENARDVEVASVARRGTQLEEVSTTISASYLFTKIAQISQLVLHHTTKGLLRNRSEDKAEFVATLRKLIQQPDYTDHNQNV